MGSNSHNGKNSKNGENSKDEQPFHFANRLIATVPHGRKGKHDLIVSRILADLERLDLETAIVVPLSGLDGQKMANVRSALNRATKQKKMAVATSTDEQYFYVWRTDSKNSKSPAMADGAVTNAKQRG